jgi:hypothetical protein
MKKLCLLMLLILGLGLASVYAQESPLILTRGTPVTNTLDSATIARVYFFVAVEGETVTLSADGDGDLSVGVLLTAPDGSILAQADADGDGVATITEVTLPTTANYYVTVFATSAQREGSFTLTLTNANTLQVATPIAEATTQFGVAPTPQGQTTALATSGFTPSSQILLANGIQVTLAWNLDVDLNLEVRDPLGNTLYFDSRTSAIGGEFGFDANGFCQVITPNPIETATWDAGFLPTGSYEILVFYRQACSTQEAVEFTLTVTVNGQSLEPQIGTLNPPLNNQSSVYVSSFRVNADTSGAINAGGVYPDSSLNLIPAPIAEIQANAVAIANDTLTVGAIFGEQSYQSYEFNAQPNELVTANVTAVNGSLDTLMQITDANGNLIAVNDDSNGTRNSQITNLRLANAGTYYVIISRYGKQIGGSEGEYQLLLSGGIAELPAEVLSLNLAPGDIQVALTWATNADIQLLVRDPVGDSVYDDQPTVPSGGQLLLNGNVNCNRAVGTPASYINWQQGFLRPGNYEIDVWYQNDCQDTTPVEFTLSVVVRGQIVTVERQRLQLDQHYVLAFTINADGTTSARLGGYASNEATSVQWQNETPTPLLANQPIIGQISDTNVFDVYSFEARAGQQVIIVSASTSPTLDTKLFLISPTGVQVAENDDSGTTSPTDRGTDAVIASFVLPENGLYTIIATRYATIFGGTIGGYQLTLTLN